LVVVGPPPPRAPPPALLDDFEDGDSYLETTSGTDGYWFVYSDHTRGTISPPDGSMLTPTPDGAAGTAHSAHISGGGFTEFGAGVIMWPSAQQCVFDMSSVLGIDFWIKGATSSSSLQVSVATTQTVDPSYCGESCNDFHSARYALTDTWTHYRLPWSDLRQEGWGPAVPFVASQVEYLQFSFEVNVTFSLYLDEVSFF
jgi:hypothetical protein